MIAHVIPRCVSRFVSVSRHQKPWKCWVPKKVTEKGKWFLIYGYSHGREVAHHKNESSLKCKMMRLCLWLGFSGQIDVHIQDRVFADLQKRRENVSSEDEEWEGMWRYIIASPTPWYHQTAEFKVIYDPPSQKVSHMFQVLRYNLLKKFRIHPNYSQFRHHVSKPLINTVCNDTKKIFKKKYPFR